VSVSRVGAPVLAFLILPVAPLAAQTPPEPPPRFTTETSAVVLDVVVRDARGRPVTSLTRDDFEVFEDRRRQTITAFEAPALRREGEATVDTATRARGESAASPPRVVALVFEQLGPASRALAAQAAHRLVASLDGRDFAGVFTVDRAAHLVAAYAPPASGVREAIDRAALRPGMPLRRAGGVAGAEFNSEERGRATRETRDEAKRNRGMATLDALSGIVRGLAVLPGRKMVVVFSEGLALDQPEDESQSPRRADAPQPLAEDSWLVDGRFERFQRLVADANAAQVAFYTFDAAGLRAESALVAGFGRSPYVGLLGLAEGTGGAFVENTNDLGPGAERAADDQASYYVLGFTPGKPPGREYRRLDVRVRCEGCRVLARRGYRAGPAQQVGVRDVAPFLVLDGDGVREELPVSFAATSTSAAIDVVAALPSRHVTTGGLVTFLARVVDRTGATRALVSQHFELGGERNAGAELRFSRRLPRVAGGSIELIVYDHASRRATVLRRPSP
jgi:VWFA-related protein